MKLLIIKAGSDYFRFTEDGHMTCSLQKASVYPLDKLGLARENCSRLQQLGIDAQLYLLNITEKRFEE
jgi:hypothetical protein